MRKLAVLAALSVVAVVFSAPISGLGSRKGLSRARRVVPADDYRHFQDSGPAGGLAPRFDRFVLPLPGRIKVTSEFGLRRHPILRYNRFHKGLDLARPRGTLVHAARTGTVVYAGWRAGYGRVVEVRHSDGQRSVYGHLSKINVKKGEYVRGGVTQLGFVGSSGLSTGPHLHFEVRDRANRPVDPWLKLGRL